MSGCACGLAAELLSQPGWLATKKQPRNYAAWRTRQKRACVLGRCSPDRRLTFSAGKTTCSVRARSCSTWFDRNLRTRSQVVPLPKKALDRARGWKTASSARRQSRMHDCAPWPGQAIGHVRSAPLRALPRYFRDGLAMGRYCVQQTSGYGGHRALGRAPL